MLFVFVESFSIRHRVSLLVKACAHRLGHESPCHCGSRQMNGICILKLVVLKLWQQGLTTKALNP